VLDHWYSEDRAGVWPVQDVDETVECG
jgi:hypothetical protein